MLCNGVSAKHLVDIGEEVVQLRSEFHENTNPMKARNSLDMLPVNVVKEGECGEFFAMLERDASVVIRCIKRARCTILERDPCSCSSDFQLTLATDSLLIDIDEFLHIVEDNTSDSLAAFSRILDLSADLG
jgi:hypothetical protein